jgi:hypothetical protein
MKRILFPAALIAGMAGDASALPLAVPFDFQDNQVFLQAGIDGSTPRWFILDSGASACVVDKALARKLHLRTSGSRRGTGAGKGAVEMGLLDDVSYSLPGARFTIPKSYAIDFSGQKSVIGREVAGILGYDFFARYIVSLDFETHIMTLSDPESFQGTGEPVALTFEKKTPRIAVRIKIGDGDAVERTLLVDSGSQDAVDDDAFAASPVKLDVVGGVGLGQEFHTTIARAQWAEIGRFRLAAPLGSPGGVPLIGLETLRRFDVAFDYAHARLFLTPNREFAEPFAMDASGLDLRWTKDLKNFAVHDVARDTPAFDAGIKAGDEIESVNSQQVHLFRIAQIQQLLTRDGSEVTLGLKGGRNVTLKLRKRL